MAFTKVFIFLAWISFGIAALLYFVLATEYNRIIIFKEPIPDKVLPGHVIRTETVIDEGSCRLECYMEPNCVSINVGPVVEEIRTCELKNFTDKSPSHSGLEEKKGYIHYAVENFCHRSRCPGKNNLCQVGFTDKGYRCVCRKGYKGDKCRKVYKNCAELYLAGHRISGVYPIDPDNGGAFDVYCDQTTDGGGWTVFQKRLDGSVNFYRGWDDYKRGFGNLNGEFWLGLDKIHRLTKEKSRLRVDLEDTTGKTAYAEYSSFGVADESNEYKLSMSLGKYSGTAGDSLTYHRGMEFSTNDRDNDKYIYHCATIFKGACWYKSCHNSNLNGLYHKGKHSSYADGVNWYRWKGHYYSAKRAEMKIKPVKAKN